MTAGPAIRGVVKALGVGVVIVVALVVILTALRTELPRNPGVMSDALGPDSGEPVATYVARAEDSLSEDSSDGGGADPAGSAEGQSFDAGVPRWTLVTAEDPWTVEEANDVVADLDRVSQLILQVPVDGVAMPVVDVTVAEPVVGESSREAAFSRAIEQAAGAVDPGEIDGEDRAATVDALTASRLQSGEPAIIGLVVRGTTDQARTVASAPGVRTVEALPGDAVWGQFAVRVLQPQQIEAADPLPDHAPVPPA